MDASGALHFDHLGVRNEHPYPVRRTTQWRRHAAEVAENASLCKKDKRGGTIS